LAEFGDESHESRLQVLKLNDAKELAELERTVLKSLLRVRIRRLDRNTTDTLIVPFANNSKLRFVRCTSLHLPLSGSCEKN
jgi:hypothetical protein